MRRPTRPPRPTPSTAAAAALSLVLTLLPVSAARAAEPAATGRAASPIVAPWARCDLRTAAQIERSFALGQLMPLSVYDDDPFVADAGVECLAGGGFVEAGDGLLALANARVRIEDEPFIYRLDPASGRFERFAWNPWPRLRDGHLVGVRGARGRARLAAFTNDAPDGERREIVPSTWGGERRAEELERADIVVSADALQE